MKMRPCTPALCILLMIAGGGIAANRGPGPASIRPSLVVIDLLDPSRGTSSAAASLALRATASKLRNFAVPAAEETDRAFTAYGRQGFEPCSTIQCAFDQGSLLEARYTLFGSVFPRTQPPFLTLKLLDVPAGKVVWSLAATVPSTLPEERFFGGLLAGLDSFPLSARPATPGPETAVIRAGADTLLSPILFEVLTAQALTRPGLRLMSSDECLEIFSTAGFSPDTTWAVPEVAAAAVGLLGVQRLLIHIVSPLDSGLQLLAYDALSHSMVLAMTSPAGGTIDQKARLQATFLEALALLDRVKRQ